ncbi:MAG: TRAP transporter small permease subunit, partial [Alphaproteobacteria bacterium]
RIIYYGASLELLATVFLLAGAALVIGLRNHAFLWRIVYTIEGGNRAVGRFVSWGLLLMVIQQTFIVLLQRIFRVSEISISPFGYAFTRDVGWYSEELRLYNAAAVALCAAYTFVEGGHVRVDLFYAGLRWRAKRVVDMLGSLFFVLPFMIMIWWFGWFFMWRHLLTPKVAATDTFVSLMRKSALMRWNVETISFSPAGFDGYFLFKILLVLFAASMFLQGLAFFYRNLLEFIEGPGEAEAKADEDIGEITGGITGDPRGSEPVTGRS